MNLSGQTNPATPNTRFSCTTAKKIKLSILMMCRGNNDSITTRIRPASEVTEVQGIVRINVLNTVIFAGGLTAVFCCPAGPRERIQQADKISITSVTFEGLPFRLNLETKAAVEGALSRAQKHRKDRVRPRHKHLCTA